MDKNADKNMVKKVMTFKAGKFAFSRNYDSTAIEKAQIETRVLRETVEDLPILPALTSKLEAELVRRSIFGTAALEGNPLSEERVGEILSEQDKSARNEQDEQEINNLKEVYGVCRDINTGGLQYVVNEPDIKEIHNILTQKVEHETNRPGKYRDDKVQVGNKEHGGIYTPPRILPDIEKLMTECVAWLNSDELMNEDPLVRAALAHYHLAAIHPFADGNGRTARLIEALILRSDGMKYVPEMLSNYYYKNMDDYYWAFSLSEKSKGNDVTPFVSFVFNAVNASYYELKNRMTGFIRMFALRDYFNFLRNNKLLTARQHNLLRLLLELSVSFSLNDLLKSDLFDALYSNVSERTARRDIEKLRGNNYIVKNAEGKYKLNLKAIEQALDSPP
jgi:cell filamentation protein, protein adenylyltransferase